jgi:hypothetical protein
MEHGIQLGSENRSSENSDGIFQTNQRRWMQTQGLWNALSSRERTLLEKPLGTWSTQEVANGQWRGEALGVLLWALKPNGNLPPYDYPNANVMDSLPPPSDSARFVRNAKLRDAAEIIKARSVAELWLWRARTTQLQSDDMTLPGGVDLPEGWTFEKIIATAAEKAHGHKLFVPIDHDFPALNKAYAKLSEEEWCTMRSIAQERLYALNWLCKYAEDWDAVPTGT